MVEGVQTLAHAGHEDVKPSFPIALVVAGLVNIALHILMHLAVGDLVKRESGFLSITGTDVVVNRVVRTNGRRIEEDPKTQESVALMPVPSGVSQRKSLSKEASRPCCPTEQAESEAFEKLLISHQEASTQTPPVTPQASRTPQFIRRFCSSVLLVTTGGVIIFFQHKLSELADPLLGILAVVIMFVTFYPAMKESGLILLQTVPKHIDVPSLKRAILDEFPGILSIHDMHVWCLTSTQVIATCHLSLPAHTTESYQRLAMRLERFLADKGITLATVQPEFEIEQRDAIKSSFSCRYRCKSNKEIDCITKKCCHEKDDEECENVLVNANK